MAKLCDMKVSGRTTGTVVVANSILQGKVSKLIAFNTVQQIKGALALDKQQIIKIHGEFPEAVQEKLGDSSVHRLANQTFGKEVESASKTEELKPANPSQDPPEDDTPNGEISDLNVQTPDTSVPVDPVSPADEDVTGEVAPEFEGPSNEAPDEEVNDGLGREAFLEMTAKELKAHIKANNLEIKGVSGMNAGELKDAVLAHYGLEAAPAEEN